MRDRDPDIRAGRRLATVGVAVSAALAASSLVAGAIAQSTSVVALGLEFAGDVLGSTIVLGGMVVAARPPDRNHPYGHGRAEQLAGFVVGLLVMAGGAAIGYVSLQGIGSVHPAPGWPAVAVLLVAIVVRAVMSTVKFRVGRRIRSGALVADAWNDAVDIVASVAALTAVALTMIDPVRYLAADHYGGFVVGVIVIAIGLRIARDSSLDLVDTMPEPDKATELRAVAAAVPGVLAVDKSLARKTGLRYHVDLHIHVDGALSVTASHRIAGRVRAEVRRQLPWVADVLVHVEPAGEA